jgi:hypothetical protein
MMITTTAWQGIYSMPNTTSFSDPIEQNQQHCLHNQKDHALEKR